MEIFSLPAVRSVAWGWGIDDSGGQKHAELRGSFEIEEGSGVSLENGTHVAMVSGNTLERDWAYSECCHVISQVVSRPIPADRLIITIRT
jgi:hypothetical protein